MKSDLNVLRSRGYIEGYDLSYFQSLNQEQLLQQLQDQLPVNRSAAVRVISQKYGVMIEVANALLEQLQKEQKLYTRLEICTALAAGNEITAKQMLPYLGKIGINQHKALPERPSLKKSYPLPRDLIARSLGRMKESIMPVLNDALAQGEPEQIPELLDAIGYLAFYNEAAATIHNLDMILKTIEAFKDNSFIVWKGILCLSAFPFAESVSCLQNIVKQKENDLFVAEAQRALRLMRKPITSSIGL